MEGTVCGKDRKLVCQKPDGIELDCFGRVGISQVTEDKMGKLTALKIWPQMPE